MFLFDSLEDIIRRLDEKIFYRTERIGQHDAPFMMWKFRTMHDDSEVPESAFDKFDKEDGRVLWYGKLLRTMFIDEFPQVYNILKGEMTLVGPRALPEKQLTEFPEDIRNERKEFKPGFNIWYASDKPLTYENVVEIERAFINMARKNYLRAQIYFGLKALYNLATLKQKTR